MLQARCPRCGTENAPGTRFCTSCGAELPTETASSPDEPFRPPPPQTPPRRRRSVAAIVGWSLFLLALAGAGVLGFALAGSASENDRLERQLEDVRDRVDDLEDEKRALEDDNAELTRQYGTCYEAAEDAEALIESWTEIFTATNEVQAARILRQTISLGRQLERNTASCLSA